MCTLNVLHSIHTDCFDLAAGGVAAFDHQVCHMTDGTCAVNVLFFGYWNVPEGLLLLMLIIYEPLEKFLLGCIKVPLKLS